MDTLISPEWKKFEQDVANAIERIGWRVELTKSSHDFGADVIAKCLRETLVIQCKYFSEERLINNAVVREVMVAKQKYNAKLGLIVYKGSVSRKTFEYAMVHKVAMLTKEQIVAGCFFDRNYFTKADSIKMKGQGSFGTYIVGFVQVSCPHCSKSNSVKKGCDIVLECSFCGKESFHRT
jgi:Holliday junction resolvase